MFDEVERVREWFYAYYRMKEHEKIYFLNMAKNITSDRSEEDDLSEVEITNEKIAKLRLIFENPALMASGA